MTRSNPDAERRYQRKWTRAKRRSMTSAQKAEERRRRREWARKHWDSLPPEEQRRRRAVAAEKKRQRYAELHPLTPAKIANRKLKARLNLQKANEVFRPIKIPDTGIAPEIRWLFAEMNRQQVTITMMAERSGVSVSVIQSMRRPKRRHSPYLVNFLACVGVLDCYIAFIPNGHAVKVGRAEKEAA